jgi:hypothetical protein
VRRALGGLILALVLLPWYRLVAWRGVGPSSEQTLRLGSQYFLAHWAGLLLGLVLILVLSRLLRPAHLATAWGAVKRRLVQPPALHVGVALALLATGLSLAISLWALNRRPVLLDGASQLIQARYFAAGLLAGPALPDPAFWEFQFMTRTPAGWASQYPPGFPVILALGLRAGVVWLVGPVLLGATVCLTTLVAERLFPQDRETARVGSVLVAVSYFLAFHAGSYMNHALAAALVGLAVFASLRALDDTWRWALLSGAAVGALFATRPLVAVVLGFFATVLVWAIAPARARLDPPGWTRRVAAATCGALPFVLGVMAYNARLFGNPLRFGYLAVAGPAHGLGFHADPFGSPYGLREALGHTSADLLGLSLDLLQTPLPVLVLIGLYLLRAPSLDRGTRLTAAWALLPVAGNALYWHHDLFMGPRLLYEAAPGWCLLGAGAALHLIRSLPVVPPGHGGRARSTGRATRAGVAVTFVLALGVGVVLAGPAKVRSYAVNGRAAGVTLAPPLVERPALVFVHEAWASRLGTRLAALGVRVDSIRAALQGNTTCELERLVRVREGEEAGRLPSAQPDSLPGGQRPRVRPLRDLVMPSGSTIRTYTGEVLTPECEREAASDYEMVLALPPLLWQGDLPGLEARGAMYVRDLGPDWNARLLSRFPEREPALLTRLAGGELRLIPYAAGMKRLWSVE